MLDELKVLKFRHAQSFFQKNTPNKLLSNSRALSCVCNQLQFQLLLLLFCILFHHFPDWFRQAETLRFLLVGDVSCGGSWFQIRWYWNCVTSFGCIYTASKQLTKLLALDATNSLLFCPRLVVGVNLAHVTSVPGKIVHHFFPCHFGACVSFHRGVVIWFLGMRHKEVHIPGNKILIAIQV